MSWNRSSFLSYFEVYNVMEPPDLHSSSSSSSRTLEAYAQRARTIAQGVYHRACVVKEQVVHRKDDVTSLDACLSARRVALDDRQKRWSLANLEYDATVCVCVCVCMCATSDGGRIVWATGR